MLLISSGYNAYLVSNDFSFRISLDFKNPVRSDCFLVFMVRKVSDLFKYLLLVYSFELNKHSLLPLVHLWRFYRFCIAARLHNTIMVVNRMTHVDSGQGILFIFIAFSDWLL